MDFQYSPPTLTLDTSHDVLITQVTDAGHFHCQQVSSFEPLKLLSNMLQLYCESMASQSDRITRVLRDQACLAKHNGTWYRAFVRELLGDGQVEVTFVDYGRSEVIQPTALRKMRAEFCELPIQAVLCGLSDIQPTGAFWTPEQSAQLEDIIRDKTFTAKFIRLNESQEVCVVELWDSGQNINKLFAQKAGLVASNVSSLPNSRILKNPTFDNTQNFGGSKNLSSAQSGMIKNNQFNQNQSGRQLSGASATSIPAKSSCSYTHSKIAIGQRLDMTVVYVDTPSDFWCQANDRINDIDLMMDKLNIVYSQQVDIPAIQDLKVNSPCVAKYSEDNRWYRALVTKDDNTYAEVQFVDYGNLEYINVTELKVVMDEFFDLPIMCSHCALSQVCCSGPEWTDKAIAKFEEFTLGMAFKSNIKGIDENGRLLIELVNISSPKDSVNQQMVQLGLAKQSELCPSSTMLAYKDFAPSVGMTYEAVISWMDSPHRFWCQSISHQKDIESLGRSVQMHYSKESSTQPITTQLIAGSVVVSKFASDGQWYRARVIQPGMQKVKVQFVDYGNSSEESLTNLREMEKMFLEHPIFAFECSLRNAEPSGNKWSSTVVSKIQSLLCDQSVSISVCSKEANTHIVDVRTAQGSLTDQLAAAHEIKGSSARPALDNQPKYPDTLLFEPGTTVDVYISHIDSATSFSCQLLQSTELLEHILDDLDAAYSTSEPNNTISYTTNMACVAQCSEDGVWYRAQVIEITKSSLRVCFVDYGNSELTNVSSLRHITANFTKDPCQAVHCCLDGINMDSSELTTHLTDLTTDKPLNAKILSFDGSKFVLQLTDKASGLNINVELCRLKPSHHSVVRTYPRQSLPVSITSAFVSEVSSIGELYLQSVTIEDQLQQLTDILQVHGEKFDSGQSKIIQVEKGMSCCSKFSADEAWYRAVVTDIKDNTVTVNFVDFGNEQTIPATPICLHQVPDELISIPPLAYKCKIVEERLSNEQVLAMKELLIEQEVDFQIINKTEPYLVSVKNKSDTNIKDIIFPATEKTALPSVSHKTYAPDRLPKEHSCLGYISHVEPLSGDVFIQLCEYEDELYSLDKDLQILLGGSGDTHLPARIDRIGAPCCAVFSEDNKWYRSVVVDDKDSHVHVRFVDYGNSDTVIKSSLRDVPIKLMTVPPLSLRCRFDGISRINSVHADMIIELTEDKVVTVDIKTTTEPYLICVILDDGTKLNDKLSANKASAQNIKVNDQTTTQLAASFPSRLPPGQNVTGYISDIDEHGVLYIGQFAEDNTLDEVTEKLDLYTEQFASDTYNISNNDIKIGFCCCAISPADREWYRAVVIAILEEGNVKVRFVDYGDSSVINKSNLRSVPGELMDTPACCVKAKLHTKDSLSESEIRLVKYHVTDLPINIEFVSIVEPLTVSFKLHTGSDVLTLFSPGKQQMLTPFVVPAEKTLAYVVNIDTSSTLHIQLIRDEGELDKVYLLIEKYKAKFEDGHNTFGDIVSGTYCCAKFTEDQTWYRALVTNIVDEQVNVRFIDYGNSDTVSQNALRSLPEDLASIPPLCITAYLDGHEQLSPPEITDLNNSLHDESVYVSFKSLTEPYRVCIETKQGSKILTKSSVTTVASATPVASTLPSLPSKVISQFLEPIIPSQFSQAYVISIDYTGLLHLQLANSDDKLDEIAELIEHHLAVFESDCTVFEPSNGGACIAKFSEDLTWYRAKITAIAGQQITVTFVDYGNTDTIEKTELRSVPTDLLQIPQVSIPAKFNIERSLTEDEIVLLRSNIIDKELAVTFLSMPDSYVVNITQEDGADVLDLLTDKSSSTVTQPTITMHSQKFPRPHIPSDKSLAYILSIDSAGLLHLQLANSDDKLDEIAELIEHHLAVFESDCTVFEPSNGGACIAKFSEDLTWYRAKITAIAGQQITVTFVDYGNTDTIEKTELRSVPTDLLQIPQVSIPAKFNIERSLTEDEIVLLRSNIIDKELAVTFLSMPDSYVVNITQDGADVLDLLTDKSSSTVTQPTITMHSQKFPPPHIPSDKSLAYILSIDSAGLLHIQVASSDDKLNEVANLIQLHSAEFDKGDADISEPVIGSACIGRFSDDMMWYRAEITGITGDHVNLRFVDYGNKETVRKNEIKVVPIDLLQIPQLLIPAKLNMERPLTEDDIVLLRHQIIDKELAVTFISMPDLFTVNIEQENGADVLDLLSDKTISDTKQTIESLEAMHSEHDDDVPDTSMSALFPDPVLPDETALGYVLCIEQPGTLYIQMSKDESDIAEVGTIIERFTEALNDTGYATDVVHVGMACCSRYSEDGQWYRSLITHVDTETVSVRFVDYGNFDTLKRSQVRILPKELSTTPVLCLPCTLAGLQTFSDTEMQVLNENILDKPVSITFMSKIKPYQVNIHLDNGENVLDLVSNNKVDPAIKPDYTDKTGFTSPEIPKGCFQAYISNVHDSVLYLQFLENENKINEMADKVQDFTDILEANTRPADLCDGTVCCAKFTADECWYRAVVIDIIESSCTVLFVDYGNVETILQSDIRSIPSDLLNEPILAVPCLLFGKETFSDSEMKHLRSLMHDQVFMAELKSSSVPPRLSILLDDGRDLLDVLDETTPDVLEQATTDVLEQATPDVLEEAMPDVLEEAMPAILEEATPDVLEEETPDAIEEAEIDETDGPQEMSNQNSKDPAQHAHASIYDGTASQEESITYTRHRFQQTCKEFLCGNKLILCVTHSINPHLFWCQESSAAPVLKELSNKLHSTYADFNQTHDINIPLLLHNVQIGDACVTQFTEDEQFYRSEVLSLDSDFVEVLLVDFGISDKVKKSSIREITDDLLTPMPQAFRCCLNGVSPVTGDSWSSSAYQHFEDLTHQKELSAEVVDCVSGKLAIVLCDNEQDIGQELINIGVAKCEEPMMNGDAADHGDLIVLDTVDSHEDLLIDLYTDSQLHKGVREVCNDISVEPTDLSIKCTDGVESEELLIDLASQTDEDCDVIGVDVRNTLLIQDDDTDNAHRQSESKTNGIEIDRLQNSGDHVEIYLSDFSYMQLEEEAELRVQIANIVNPSQFTVHPRESQSDLEQLEKDINEHIDQAVQDVILEPGYACLAHSTGKESWCRASIIRADGEKMVTVQYVDYGNQETLTCDRIRGIHSRFLELPAQSIPCCLSDITYVDGHLEWTEESISCFKDLCNNRCLLARASKVFAWTTAFSVYLYDEEDETAVSINRTLIDAGMAVVISDSELEIEIEVEQVLENDQMDELEESFREVSMHKINDYYVDDKEDDSAELFEVEKEASQTLHVVSTDTKEDTCPSIDDVAEVPCDYDIPDVIMEHDIAEVTNELDVRCLTNELDVIPVTNELNIEPVTNELDIEPVTNELDIEPVTNELDIEPVTNELDIKPVTNELDIEPVTNELDIEQVTNELDIEPVTNELDIEPVTNELDIESVTNELDIEPVTNELDIESVTNELDIESVTNELDIEPVTNERDIESVTNELDIESVTNELDIEPVTNELDIEPMTNELDIEPVTNELDIESVTNELDIEPVTSEQDVAEVTNDLDVMVTEQDVTEVTNEINVEVSKQDVAEMTNKFDVEVTNGVAEGITELGLAEETYKDPASMI